MELKFRVIIREILYLLILYMSDFLTFSCYYEKFGVDPLHILWVLQKKALGGKVFAAKEYGTVKEGVHIQGIMAYDVSKSGLSKAATNVRDYVMYHLQTGTYNYCKEKLVRSFSNEGKRKSSIIRFSSNRKIPLWWKWDTYLDDYPPFDYLFAYCCKGPKNIIDEEPHILYNTYKDVDPLVQNKKYWQLSKKHATKYKTSGMSVFMQYISNSNFDFKVEFSRFQFAEIRKLVTSYFAHSQKSFREMHIVAHINLLLATYYPDMLHESYNYATSGPLKDLERSLNM